MASVSVTDAREKQALLIYIPGVFFFFFPTSLVHFAVRSFAPPLSSSGHLVKYEGLQGNQRSQKHLVP